MSISISNSDKPCTITLTWKSAFRHRWTVELSKPSEIRKPWLYRVVVSLGEWIIHRDLVFNDLDEFDTWCEKHHCKILQQEYSHAKEKRELRVRSIQANESVEPKLPKNP